MLTKLVDRLLELSKPVLMEVDGVRFWTDTCSPIVPQQPTPLVFNTLTGLVDYVKVCEPSAGSDLFALHVVSHQIVNMIGVLDDTYLTRGIEAKAQLQLPGPEFRKWMDQDAFSIYLQTGFEHTATREKVLAMAGSVDAQHIRTSKDDGQTQTVSALKGIVLRERKEIPNPIHLTPYRTFREIEQPQSPFVFRARETPSGVEFALFPADGDAWTLTAVMFIKGWLEDALGGKGVPILA